MPHLPPTHTHSLRLHTTLRSNLSCEVLFGCGFEEKVNPTNRKRKKKRFKIKGIYSLFPMLYLTLQSPSHSSEISTTAPVKPCHYFLSANATSACSTAKPQVALSTLQCKISPYLLFLFVFFLKGRRCKTKTPSIAVTGHAFPLRNTCCLFLFRLCQEMPHWSTSAMLFPPEHGQKPAGFKQAFGPEISASAC